MFDGSVAFIRRLRDAGLKTAVVSASKNTVPILKAAGLADLFDVCVDGVEAERLGLKGKPSPDTFLHAAKLLGVPPRTRPRAWRIRSPGSRRSGPRASGWSIGVDRTGQGAALAAHGAGVVVPDLSGLQVRAKGAGDPARNLRARDSGPSMRDRPPISRWRPAPTRSGSSSRRGSRSTREHEVESLFTVGNGYVGTRGFVGRGELRCPRRRPSSPESSTPSHGASPELATVPDWDASLGHRGRPAPSAGSRPIPRASSDPGPAAGDRLARVAAPGRRRSRHAHPRPPARLLRRPAPADPVRHVLTGELQRPVSIDATIGGSLTKRTATGAPSRSRRRRGLWILLLARRLRRIWRNAAFADGRPREGLPARSGRRGPHIEGSRRPRMPWRARTPTARSRRVSPR